MEVLYHTRPYFVGICPYIGLKNRPYIYGRYLQLGRFLSHGHWCPYKTLDFRWVNPQTIRHRVGTTIANYTIIDYALVIPYHIIIWYNMQVWPGWNIHHLLRCLMFFLLSMPIEFGDFMGFPNHVWHRIGKTHWLSHSHEITTFFLESPWLL